MLRDDAIRAGKIRPTKEDIERMGLVEKPKKKEVETGRKRRIKPDKR